MAVHKDPIIENPSDPVFVQVTTGKSVELRIGESKRGRSRFSFLKPGEARIVAYALLSAAEHVDAARRK